MITITPITAPTMSGVFDLPDMIDGLIGRELEDGDVLVVSSKFVAISEGRVVQLKSVKATERAMAMASRLGINPAMCELIIRESDEIIGGVPGFVLTVKNMVLTPNAGIDKSNIEHGKVVLYPRRPFASASVIRSSIKFRRGTNIGVIICDSRLMPTRRGTTGVALAISGVEGIRDLRGKKDLFGNVLKVTSQAIADDLSSAAQLVMGESDESVPLVLIRGMRPHLTTREADSSDLAVSSTECVYVRGFGYKFKRRIRLSS